MAGDGVKHRQRLVLLAGVLLVCGAWLWLVLAGQPTDLPASETETSPPALARQQVVIFLVDTADYFDAHGEHVHSVVRQQCAACAIHLVNLHRDLSTPAIIQALEHIQAVRQTHDPSTTALVNLSLGTYTYDAVLHARVRSLTATGVVLLASAGNDHTAQPFYPAAFPEVFGVCSSTRYSRVKAPYSNFGPWVSLCAPGLQYVTRPGHEGGLATGTSFASPMVAGALGQLLLEAPCVNPRAGLRALQRTADPPADTHYALGAGLLNSTQARAYVRHLYPCQQPPGFWQRWYARLYQMGTGMATYAGLVLYFVVSIFALPFVLAFLIDRYERRTAQRQYQSLYEAYVGTPAYRQQQLNTLRRAYARTHRLRRRQRAELAALLHALELHGEPCWWCGAAATVPQTCDWAPAHVQPACSRCGWEVQATTPRQEAEPTDVGLPLAGRGREEEGGRTPEP